MLTAPLTTKPAPRADVAATDRLSQGGRRPRPLPVLARSRLDSAVFVAWTTMLGAASAFVVAVAVSVVLAAT